MDKHVPSHARGAADVLIGFLMGQGRVGCVVPPVQPAQILVRFQIPSVMIRRRMERPPRSVNPGGSRGKRADLGVIGEALSEAEVSRVGNQRLANTPNSGYQLQNRPTKAHSSPAPLLDKIRVFGH